MVVLHHNKDMRIVSEQLPPRKLPPKKGGNDSHFPPKKVEVPRKTETNSIEQQQQNLVDKGYFIGTSGPNKNGVDGIPGKKTEYAQHALNSGIDSSTYNNIYKQQNPDLAQTIENIFGKQTPKEIPNNVVNKSQGGSTQTVTKPQDGSVTQQKAQVQKARVIKTIHPKNW
jgi:hypothetical protein